jgi:hypothetical protein
MTGIENFGIAMKNLDAKSVLVVKDLAMTFRLLTRMEEHFVNDFYGKLNVALVVIQRAVDVVQFLASNQLHKHGEHFAYL